MTLRQVFSKIGQYNEISGMIGNEKIYLYFTDLRTRKFESYVEFKEFLVTEYIDFYIDMVLNYDYDFTQLIDCDLRLYPDSNDPLLLEPVTLHVGL